MFALALEPILKAIIMIYFKIRVNVVFFLSDRVKFDEVSIKLGLVR